MARAHSLALTVQQLDTDSTVLVRRAVTISDTTPPTVGEMRVGVLTDNTQTTVNLPITQVRHLYLKNLDTVAKYTVVWTPTTGSQATILILDPGGAIAFWHTTTGSTYGISGLKITSDTSKTQYYELFIGG